MSGQWVRDGHTARVVLDIESLQVELTCPNTGDYSSIDPEHVPDCRKSWSEDGQTVDPEDTPLDFCNYAEFAENSGRAVIDSLDTNATGVRTWPINGEFPVAWRWDDEFGSYVWVPSALLDDAGVDDSVLVPRWALRLVLASSQRFCKVCIGLSPAGDGHAKNPPCVGHAREVLREVLREASVKSAGGSE